MSNETAKYEWTVYYKGPEGYAESIHLTLCSADELSTQRTATMAYLESSGAVVQPRDREPIVATPKVVGQAAPSRQNAPQPGVTPACPECGSGMILREGGTVKNPNSARFGQSYPGFWSCSRFPGCRGRMNA